MTPRPNFLSTLSNGLAAWRDNQARIRAVTARAAHAARLAAVRAGLHQKEIAILHAGEGRLASGLFSEAASVIGLLDDFETHREQYGGVRIVFGAGLYHDDAAGPNWWEYYFGPVRAGVLEGRERVISHHFHDYCARRTERTLGRERAADLVQRYVTVAAPVLEVVDGFVARSWSPHVIGVHYRGTDKFVDARRVPYGEMEREVRSRLRPDGESRIFVATDEAAFVTYMRERFPGLVAARDMFRSLDGSPIDIINDDTNHRKGLDAVVDCLLLSRTHTLVRTASNLGLFATLFNPRLPVTLLNPEP